MTAPILSSHGVTSLPRRAKGRAVVDLVALRRSGCRESDLQALVPESSGQAWDELAFAQMRRASLGWMEETWP